MLATAFTLSGPVIGATAIYLNLPPLFWFGVALATLNLFLNLAFGIMKLPIFPTLFVIAGSIAWSPWYMGAAFGLLTAGPGCLNRFSASISGASTGVMPPGGLAAG